MVHAGALPVLTAVLNRELVAVRNSQAATLSPLELLNDVPRTFVANPALVAAALQVFMVIAQHEAARDALRYAGALLPPIEVLALVPPSLTARVLQVRALAAKTLLFMSASEAALEPMNVLGVFTSIQRCLDSSSPASPLAPLAPLKR